jgi:hypothetical protein
MAQTSAADGLTALQRCIDENERCTGLAAILETELSQRHDAACARQLAAHITQTLRCGDATPVLGEAIAHCRGGHRASCRALWWVIDRLYLAQDASLARANECALTHAFASAVEVAAKPASPDD